MNISNAFSQDENPKIKGKNIKLQLIAAGYFSFYLYAKGRYRKNFSSEVLNEHLINFAEYAHLTQQMDSMESTVIAFDEFLHVQLNESNDNKQIETNGDARS